MQLLANPDEKITVKTHHTEPRRDGVPPLPVRMEAFSPELV